MVLSILLSHLSTIAKAANAAKRPGFLYTPEAFNELLLIEQYIVLYHSGILVLTFFFG
jgi:hypothetical protein